MSGELLTAHDARCNRWLASLVLVSLLVSVATIVLSLGIRVTPYETTDSQGRPMGFNDPLSAEHYLIIAQLSASPSF